MKPIIGSIVSFCVCFITLPLAIFPVIQANAVSSRGIYRFVKTVVVNQSSPTKCEAEIIWTCAIDLAIALLVTGLTFYFLLRKNTRLEKIETSLLLVLMCFLFYHLQTPFFIFEVGTNYNCVSDGQTGMAVLSSSPKVSFAIAFVGIFYDVLKSRMQKRIG
ncbi:hypothetical protein [Flavobacterium sp.]|uniref:hypothetical protein n=1 Tax=Flavobacterium sp. TaxID=239 RepID=UPI00121E2604|nr:hypothetical protein [Flavobacterium sp.]RZJ71831.1 MAG: hypothetical protein EOO49_09200 [Flavobacterium sp.]